MGARADTNAKPCAEKDWGVARSKGRARSSDPQARSMDIGGTGPVRQEGHSTFVATRVGFGRWVFLQ